MSVLATFTVSATDFTLGETLNHAPGTTIRLDRVVPTGEHVIPYVWATVDSIEAIESKLTDEPDVDSFTVVDTVDDEALIRIEWADRNDGLLSTIEATDATILEAFAEHETWRLQLRFDDHDQLSTFFRRCTDEGVSVDLETIHTPGQQHDSDESRLTDRQLKTLQVALNEGYFAVPRGTTLIEIAETLGISDTAVSQRLRRGVATVLEETLFRPADEDDQN